MLRLLRIALQVVLFFLLLGAVVGLASPDTGVLEKAALAVVVAGLVWLASWLRTWRSGPRSSSASTPPA